jgi:hypothetical protein
MELRDKIVEYLKHFQFGVVQPYEGFSFSLRRQQYRKEGHDIFFSLHHGVLNSNWKRRM